MNPNDVKTVAVVGAGTMGHSIAQVFAQAGIEVNLVDTNQRILNRAIELINSNLNILVESNRIAKSEIKSILKRIHPCRSLTMLRLRCHDSRLENKRESSSRVSICFLHVYAES